MHRPERTSRSDRQIPSFSSTLLDKIYRSIDESDPQLDESRSGRLSKCSVRGSRVNQDPQIDGIIRDCLAGKAMEKKVSTEWERKMKGDDDFFSSNSSSSDSSSGGFSSSDTESIYGVRPRVSSSVLPPIPRPKPVRTGISAARLAEERQRTLFQEQRRMAAQPLFQEPQVHEDETMAKSKSRALKFYANLKKVKQPISPGGRLSNFINSLFASGNVKKPKGFDDSNTERNSKSAQASACSSAASFSRSCLSRNQPGTREKLRDVTKRTVRFYPVSVIVDEDLKPCGHKSLYGSDEPTLTSVPVPSNRKAGRSPGRKAETAEVDTRRNVAVEKPRSVEEAARDFLRDYHRNQKRNRSNPLQSYRGHCRNDAYDEDDDDDTASCSSSDLFELDHLAVIGSTSRYCEELPVYETTRVGRNLAIANGLMV